MLIGSTYQGTPSLNWQSSGLCIELQSRHTTVWSEWEVMHFVFYCTANSVNTISSVQSSSRNIIIFMLFGNIMVTSDDGYTGLAPKRWRNSGPCRRLMHCLCNIAGCVRCQVLMYRLDEQSRVMCHVCPRHRFVCPKVRCAKVSTALYRSSGSRNQGNVIVRRCFFW